MTPTSNNTTELYDTAFEIEAAGIISQLKAELAVPLSLPGPLAYIGRFRRSEQIQTIAQKAKALSALPHDEWLKETARLAKGQQKRNCEFCRKHPEKCQP